MGIGGAPAWSRRGYEAARAGESGGDSDLVRFVETLAFIERAATGPRGASSDDVEALVTEALKILVARGIKPRRSRVSAMYEDLHRAAAAFHGRAGSAALRVWHTLLLGECGAEVDALPAEDSRLAVREIARRRMRSGAVAGVRALVGARRLPEHGSLEELRALRLAGAHFEALSMADAMRRAGGVVDGSRLAWEMACNRTHLSAETTPVIEFLRGSEGPSPERSAWLALYEFAAPRKRAAERVEGIAALEVDEPVADVLAVLRACHDQTTPVHSRLHHAGLALVQPAGGESDAEAELLLLASLARWTFQLKKHAMTGVIVGAYRDLSLALSGGQSEDVLGFVSDIQDALDRRPARSGTVDIDDDGSWAHRAGGTAAMIAEIATQLGVSRTRQLFASGERAKRLQRDERAALMGTLVRRVDGLKGPFLKLAQQLSYIGLDLDPETDARLRALQDQSSSVPFDGIERVVREELGKLPRALFAEFSEAPIGVGSVGQVHAARLHDGTEVAVKVQFPGIRAAIEHDLWHAGLTVPVARVMRPKIDWRSVLAFLRSSLLAECDYAREATAQEAFRRHFEGDPVLHVPRVYGEFSSTRVLTMERVRGASLERFAADAPYAERRTAAEAVLRLMFAFADGRYTWSDPHPGNYLFADDRLWVLDFGCVAEWSPDTRLRWVRLGQGMMNGDEAALRRGIRELGFPVDPDRFDYDEFVTKFGPDFYRPTKDEGGVPLHTAGVVTAQLVEFFSRKSANFHNIQVPPELLLGLRAYYGTLYVLAELGTGVDRSSVEFHAAVDTAVRSAELALAPS